jgi:hypothetical protein
LVVVDRILWTGDDATAPRPLTAASVASVLAAAQGSQDVREFGDGRPFIDCGEQLPTAWMYSVESGNGRTPGATLINLEPTVDAMRRAAPTELTICETQALIDGVMTSTKYQWVIVANAAVLVRINGEPTAADLAFIEGLRLVLGANAGTS